MADRKLLGVRNHCSCFSSRAVFRKKEKSFFLIGILVNCGVADNPPAKENRYLN